MNAKKLNTWLVMLAAAGAMIVSPSCPGGHAKPGEVNTAEAVASVPGAETSCPRLTAGNEGTIVLSWVKKSADGSTVMCYAVSENKGISFGDTVEILPGKGVSPHAENLPKLLFRPGGQLIAAWGIKNPNPANKHSGLVFYSQSFDNGKTWSDAIPLVKDTAGYDQRYFDLAVLPNGEAAIIWLDNRAKAGADDGSSLYFAVTSGKNGFGNEKVIGETCCPCCRTDLYVDSKGYIHAAYRDILDSIRDMVHIVSVDGGKSFSPPKRISEDNWVIDGCPHTGPSMAENESGLHFAWFTEGGGAGVYYSRSTTNGAEFSARQLVSTAARHPQLVQLPGGAVAIVWEESVKNAAGSFSKIVLQVTNADGKQKRYPVTADNVKASYPVLIPVGDNTVLVAWTQDVGDKQQVHHQLVHAEEWN